MPAAAKASRAARWCSVSRSIVVRMPSAGMPPSSQRPEAPAPVPISMTALAPVAAASIWSTAPTPLPTAGAPSSSPRWAASSTCSLGVTNSSACDHAATFWVLMFVTLL